MDEFISGKDLFVTRDVFDQTLWKIELMAGKNEKKRFDELRGKLHIVENTTNPRFYYMKDNNELLSVSVAEKECLTLMTGNQRMCNKIDMYYPEIKYKLFIGVQLSESKYS